ncbi:MAG TPA: AraC family transcriptional regulator [Methylomirabilota bacterium]|nr:AraC family transcriptional regulator [Methylomirabilota bacterium]
MHEKPARITGSATELVRGQPRPITYDGTYRRDLPDPHFRFKVAMVEQSSEFRLHTHEYAEILIVLAGRAVHLGRGGRRPLEAGDVVVMRPGAQHGLLRPQGLKLCLIMFDPDQILRDQRELRNLPGYEHLFAPERPGGTAAPPNTDLHLSSDEMLYVASLVSAMKSEFDHPAPGRETVVRSLFLLMVTYLSRLHQARRQNPSAILSRLHRVIDHIRAHYREPLEVAALARMACWSVSQFHRHFKKAYHTTPIQFINRLRLQEACALLCDPDRDITSIALDVGFSSSAFFSSQFRRHLGESPSQYRRRKLDELSRRAQSALRQRLAGARKAMIVPRSGAEPASRRGRD